MAQRTLPRPPQRIEDALDSVLAAHLEAGDTLRALTGDIDTARLLLGEVITALNVEPDRHVQRLTFYALGRRAQQEKVL